MRHQKLQFESSESLTGSQSDPLLDSTKPEKGEVDQIHHPRPLYHSSRAKAHKDVSYRLNTEPSRSLKLGEMVGSGVYGEVYRADYHGFPVAVKIIKSSLEDERQRDRILEELRIIRTLRHPNIVVLMDHFVDPRGHLYLITEYCARGTLKEMLPQIRSLALRLKIAKDIACGMNWLHVKSIIHRDLKPANILVSEDYTAKITDFGLSLRWNPKVVCRSFSGNVKYSAPEILRARGRRDGTIFPYCPQTDVYAFGLILWEVVTLEPPFNEVRGKTGIVELVTNGYRPPIKDEWPRLLKSLLASAWHEQQKKRPMFREIQEKFDRVVIHLICRGKLSRKLAEGLWEGKLARNIPLLEFRKSLSEVLDPGVASGRRDDPQSHTESTVEAQLDLDSFLRLVSSPLDETVNLDRFSRALNLFGPLDRRGEIFTRVADLLSREWFHGALSSSQSQRILLHQLDVSRREVYLFRFSVSSPNDFTLSYVLYDGTIVHRRVTRHKNGYQVSSDPDKFFPSMLELHRYLTEEGEIKGKYPCPRVN